MGPEKVTVLVCRVVGLVADFVGVGWDSSRRGSAGCLPSRETALSAGLAWRDELTEVEPVVDGLVEAVAPVLSGSVMGLKSEVEATS